MLPSRKLIFVCLVGALILGTGGLSVAQAVKDEKPQIPQAKDLDGWHEFRFGMSPQQVRSVATIPLSAPPSNKYPDHSIKSSVVIGATTFYVDFIFYNTTQDDNKPRYVLQSISLENSLESWDSLHCMFPEVYQALEKQYRLPLNIQPAFSGVDPKSVTHYIIEFNSKRKIDISYGSYNCNITIIYKDYIQNYQPKAPTVPRSTF